MAGISRRTFLTGAALGGAMLAGGGLVGCAPSAGKDASSSEGGESAAPATDVLAKPEPITDIAETEETEILVIGGGTAGVSCALAGVQEGAKVVLLQKGSKVMTTGGAVCAYNVPEAHERNGLPYVDYPTVIKELDKANCGGTNMPLINAFFDHLVEDVEWFIDETTSVGYAPDGWDNPFYGDSCLWYNELENAMRALAAKAEQAGAVVHYSTPAIQLVVDEAGAVTGAIARREDGSYLQVNASKGVVLASGDYTNNPELVKLWCPGAADFPVYSMPDRTGDGYLMGIWAGGHVSPYPHTKMAHPGPLENYQIAAKWMAVDPNGNRAFSQDILEDWKCNATRGSKGKYYQLFDSNYAQHLAETGQPEMMPDELQLYLDNGWCYQADTIEELAKVAGFNEGNSLVATVERYNELAAKGVDEDYHIDPYLLKPIDTPPFYAFEYQISLLAINSGLDVDAESAVVDEGGKPIEGLYAIGNCQGGFYTGMDYPFTIDGGSLARCIVFGRQVARKLAKA